MKPILIVIALLVAHAQPSGFVYLGEVDVETNKWLHANSTSFAEPDVKFPACPELVSVTVNVRAVDSFSLRTEPYPRAETKMRVKPGNTVTVTGLCVVDQKHVWGNVK